MADNIYKFRRIKWGDPRKMSVLVEDLTTRKRPWMFILLACLVSAVTFTIVYLA
ncbi:hypothetical protein C7441_112169 [Pseudaminobacter salicylatoxidans]|uniref:Uncharacterized protein n=1 Tax=Pseudaminobacter salicylatoxidans TaxID=93369 RepID=A0A316BZT5_PSESE|nr:hypothetical protein [Pseudaminobacter salicylatoxidans]PWJ80627.1 hypothetical protein C7441_112169 [Pseudaminobacter salicylatoxidans]